MPIILFDIDGTLVRTGGAGKFAMEAALTSAFGVTELRDVVKYSGRTDAAIGRDLLSRITTGLGFYNLLAAEELAGTAPKAPALPARLSEAKCR